MIMKSAIWCVSLESMGELEAIDAKPINHRVNGPSAQLSQGLQEGSDQAGALYIQIPTYRKLLLKQPGSTG